MQQQQQTNQVYPQVQPLQNNYPQPPVQHYIQSPQYQYPPNYQYPTQYAQPPQYQYPQYSHPPQYYPPPQYVSQPIIIENVTPPYVNSYNNVGLMTDIAFDIGLMDGFDMGFIDGSIF